VGATGLDQSGLTPVPGDDARFTATIDPRWMLIAVPQGGVVAGLALQAMRATLAVEGQSIRSLSAVFAGQVAAGPVEIEVTVLRRGRSISQLGATVRNPGAAAGLTAVAVFGEPRRGFDFTDLTCPDVPGPDGLRSYRDPLPDDIDFTFDGPLLPFWVDVLEARPASGRAPWEPFEEGPAEVSYWYRLDEPPLLADGSLDPVGFIVMCDTMPGAVSQKLGAESWFGPSADLTVHVLGSARPGWFLAHNRARHAGDGYASVEMALWEPGSRRLVAYATQMMFFAFGS
jgi:acyl-CoA thioesterase